ncbi:PLAT domain-containing protein 3-like [Zingiber officinale]|uniref:PLAT domain-containing protein 3-like n=1 Tax=Zingiber officinale TaxID=94328 RepID=UPI001C4CADD9|nr:PLAT domain-containing protein 3-like [Zingiber officinale]
MAPSRLVFLLSTLLLLLPFFLTSADEDDQCVYTLYVSTGTVIKAGTDATIGLTLGDEAGQSFTVRDLRKWGGLMGADHDYFELDALDAFSGRGPCGLRLPICRINLTSDGAGRHHGWYCDYLEVTATGPHLPCSQTLFYVRQWLATDAPPYSLYATVDGCDQLQGAPRQPADQRRLVVGDGAADARDSSSLSSSSTPVDSA